MKKNRVWMLISIICLVLGIGCSIGYSVFKDKTKGMEDLDIHTGVKNNCLAYDKDSNTMLVGCHDNVLMAYQDNELIWQATAQGPYSEIKLNKETGLVYAGNEDNHIYIYQLTDGKEIQNINVQRRILSLDVAEDGQSVVVATITGTSKSNVLAYHVDGTELLNNPYKIKISGVRFTADEQHILVVNNRGEIVKLNLEGKEEEKYSTNYSILQLTDVGNEYIVVCKNGAYYEFDDDLNILRSGNVVNNDQAIIRSVGTDETGEYIIVGTQEGYVFIMDGADNQIYSTNVNTEVTGFAANENKVYMTGLGDFIKVIYVENLSNIKTFSTLVKVFQWGMVGMFLLFFFAGIMAVPVLYMKTCQLGKQVWKHKMAYVMLAPSLVLIFLFNYRGIGIAFIRAFTNWSTTNNTVAKMSFSGIDNFRMMVTEGYFLVGMKNLILLVVTGILKVLTIPVLVAWLTYSISGDKRKYVHRFLFVLPIVVPGVISAMTWQKIYDPSIGLLNQILGAMSLENLQRVWLGDAKTAIWAVIFMGFPFVSAMAYLVYYGGLIGIGKEIEESARVDGANRWNIFWKIQLPLIRPQISIMVTLTIIGAMQDFNGIYILTGGGPGTATYVPALELYLNVAQFGRYGYACALGVVLFIFTMIVTLLNMKLTKSKE